MKRYLLDTQTDPLDSPLVAQSAAENVLINDTILHGYGEMVRLLP